jgi:hypothetical protein
MRVAKPPWSGIVTPAETTAAGSPGRRWLANGIAASTVALGVASVIAIFLAVPEIRHGTVLSVTLALASSGELLFALGFGTVGWLLARRRPDNVIGWCFALGGLVWAAGLLVGAWVELAMRGHVAITGFVLVLATQNFFGWILSMPLSLQLPLLFLPDGRLLSRRWRPAVWVVVAGVIVGTLGFSTLPGVIEGTDPALHLVNPLGLTGLEPLPQAMALTGAGMLLLGMAAGIVSVVLRFRRASGVERQQLRWVAFGGCCVLLAPITALTPGVPDWISNVGGNIGILATPVCVAVAVLRYRLYDLGRLVSRTVSYAVITALLLGVYLLLVTGLARLLPDGSSLAVAGSTLTAAALFQPLRRRVQGVVDRRFNRSRYDADRTVEAFTRTLRNEVDLDAVRSDLVVAVQDTLQPTTARLWLREPSGGA